MKTSRPRPAAIGCAAAVLAGAPTPPAVAHHNYASYDRCKPVSMEGTVESVAWENPHVLIMLGAADGVVYRIEWQSLTQLARSGVRDQAIERGDHLLVTGSVNKNPATKILTLVTEVRRASDGWSWKDKRPVVASCPR